MFKKLLVFVAAMYMAIAFAAVDVNKGTAAELDGVKGLGPVMSSKIIEERKKGNFKDWNDLISRVSGIGEKSAANLSTGGLTVGGAAFAGAPAAPAKAAKDKPAAKPDMKADAKPESKSDAKADAAKPAASAAKK